MKYLLILSLFLFVCRISSQQQQVVLPSNENLVYSGRIDMSDDSVYYFDWSGVEISFIISGASSIKVLMSTDSVIEPPLYENINIFNVLINNAVYSPLNITSYSRKSYDLVNEGTLVPSETYSITLTKKTEASLGIVGFYGIMVDAGAVITSPPIPTRKLEFFGDSITCGYGIDAMAPCTFSPQTENNFDTYGYIISRQLNTELHVECWSGKGVVRNYGSPNITSSNPMPSYLPLTLANNQSDPWNFDNYQPDAVIINLGTNDYSTQPSPPENVFEQGYLKLIQNIENWYSQSQPNIFLVCGPMISGTPCDYVESIAQSVGATYIDLQNILDPNDYGCAGHPNQSGHEKMANIAFPIIQKVMNW